MKEVPTLLIGLGGIGSKVVDHVYQLVPENKRDRVAVHAFDTNLNDIRKLKFLHEENITQTSSSLTVGQYLARTDQSVRDWFPNQHPEILRKSLTEGAGQIRVISRLAYRSAIEEGKLQQLKNSLNHIFRLTGDNKSMSTRVMIITSLAGGTGGGIFLQTAMYIRDLLKRTYQRENVLVRGSFLLPDTLINTGTIQGKEVENIRANAYACMKELNAITQNASVHSKNHNDVRVSIELEYKPKQMHPSGRLDHVITRENLPYDFVYMTDFENIDGGNLKYFDNYLQQVIRTTYADLFSPIAGENFSRTDNQIIALIENDGLSRYCGAGTASIIFPYEDIVDYCALKWVTNSLSKDWLHIDKLWRKILEQYEKNRDLGLVQDPPNRGSSYRQTLEDLVKDQKVKPFFRYAFLDTQILDKKGDPIGSKARYFITALEEKIRKTVTEDRNLIAARQEVDTTLADEKSFQVKDKAVHNINNLEEGLEEYKRSIEQFFNSAPTSLLNQIIIQDHDHPQRMMGNDYQLNTWILGKNHPMHPLAIRYFLYEVQEELEKALEYLRDVNKTSKDKVEKYKNTFNDDSIESAEDLIKQSLKQNLFSRLFKNKFKEDIGIYQEKSSEQFRRLNSYREDKIKELVFEALLKELNDMVEDWEIYFNNLGVTTETLYNEMAQMRRKHDESADPTIRYVMASGAIKDKFWDIVRPELVGKAFPTDISKQIYIGQYDEYYKRYSDSFGKGSKRSIRMVERFRKIVLEWCSKELGKMEVLNLNCIKAIREEAKLNDVHEDEQDQYLRKLLDEVDNLAKPLSPKVDSLSEINAWGVHPDCVAMLPSDQVQQIFNGTELSKNEAFSDKEIIRNRTLFGYKAEHFPKFYHGNADYSLDPGVYYLAYQERIRRIKEGKNTVTPHLDKNWHHLAYLPEISEERTKMDVDKINKALIWGLTSGLISNAKEYGRETWIFNNQNEAGRLIKIGEKETDTYLFDLREALYVNPAIVDRVISLFEDYKKTDKREHKIQFEEHRAISGAKNIQYFPADAGYANIIDVLLSYADQDPGNEELISMIDSLLRTFRQEWEQYYYFVFGERRKKNADEASKDSIIELTKESSLKSMEENDTRRKFSLAALGLTDKDLR